MFQERKAKEALERHSHYEYRRSMWKSHMQEEHANKRNLSEQV